MDEVRKRIRAYMPIHTHGADKASWQALQRDQDLKHIKVKSNPDDDIEPVLLDM